MKLIKQLFTPGWFTLWSRRKISRFPRSRKAKAHRQDRYLFGVVEYFAANIQPFAQPISAGIIEWHTRLVYFSTRRLACN